MPSRACDIPLSMCRGVVCGGGLASAVDAWASQRMSRQRVTVPAGTRIIGRSMVDATRRVVKLGPLIPRLARPRAPAR
eukprot:5494278-Prymnesium_polylepis.1